MIYPQAGAEPEQFEELPFRHFFLQPMDGPDRELNTTLALAYCLDHPRWRLSIQNAQAAGYSLKSPRKGRRLAFAIWFSGNRVEFINKTSMPPTSSSGKIGNTSLWLGV
ncbi:MAG: hypothetical protein WDM87_00510 [Terracidiphilus sp.]